MMVLHIDFEVAPEQESAFEAAYRDRYVPALRVQTGYLRSKLTKVFAPALVAEIDAAPTPYNYQMELVFDTEANRRRWVASPEHAVVWPLASGLARAVRWRGYDVVGEDRMGG